MKDSSAKAATRQPAANVSTSRIKQQGMSTPRLHTRAILVVALVARSLVLCYVIFQMPHAWLYSRGIEMGILAQSLLMGRGLSSPFGGSTGPTALLSPGYPFFVAVFFRVFGAFTFEAAIALMVAQLLCGVATVLLIILITRECFGALAANVAGTFWAVSLPVIWMPTIFWETSLSALLILMMIALALRSERRSNLVLWMTMGSISGIAALVNPALLPSSLAIIGWMGFRSRKTLSYLPILGVLVLLLIFTPWPIRNMRVLHAFIPLRSTIGYELWMGNRSGGAGFLDESLFPTFNRGEYNSYVSKGEVLYMRDKSLLAWTYICNHRTEFLRLTTVRVIRFWCGSGNKDGSPIFVLHALLTGCFGAFGLWQLLEKKYFGIAILFLLPVVLFPLPYYITHAEFRYRLIVDPILTILAASSAARWISSERSSHGRIEGQTVDDQDLV